MLPGSARTPRRCRDFFAMEELLSLVKKGETAAGLTRFSSKRRAGVPARMEKILDMQRGMG